MRRHRSSWQVSIRIRGVAIAAVTGCAAIMPATRAVAVADSAAARRTVSEIMVSRPSLCDAVLAHAIEGRRLSRTYLSGQNGCAELSSRAGRVVSWGRRIRPLNPSDGGGAVRMRVAGAARRRGGELPFWKMARRCEVSKSALASAVAGYELPSSRVTRAFVAVCGGDWLWWSERLAQARAQLEATCDTPSGDPPKAVPGFALVPVRRALPVEIVTPGGSFRARRSRSRCPRTRRGSKPQSGGGEGPP